MLVSHSITLREPAVTDLHALVDLLSSDEASRFGMDTSVDGLSVLKLIERAARDRAAGVSVTYVVTLGALHDIVGLVQVRQLIHIRGRRLGNDARAERARHRDFLRRRTAGRIVRFRHARNAPARIAGTASNGRAMGALRKLGAVQEGVLRRSVRRGGEYLDQVLFSFSRKTGRTTKSRPGGRPLMKLPLAARLYVGAVIAAAPSCSRSGCPYATFDKPLLFLALLALSSATAALKVTLPLTTSGSTMSVSYAVDFASLLLVGPHETMLVAAASASANAI